MLQPFRRFSACRTPSPRPPDQGNQTHQTHQLHNSHQAAGSRYRVDETAGRKARRTARISGRGAAADRGFTFGRGLGSIAAFDRRWGLGTRADGLIDLRANRKGIAAFVSPTIIGCQCDVIAPLLFKAGDRESGLARVHELLDFYVAVEIVGRAVDVLTEIDSISFQIWLGVRIAR